MHEESTPSLPLKLKGLPQIWGHSPVFCYGYFESPDTGSKTGLLKGNPSSLPSISQGIPFVVASNRIGQPFILNSTAKKSTGRVRPIFIFFITFGPKASRVAGGHGWLVVLERWVGQGGLGWGKGDFQWFRVDFVWFRVNRWFRMDFRWFRVDFGWFGVGFGWFNMGVGGCRVGFSHPTCAMALIELAPKLATLHYSCLL